MIQYQSGMIHLNMIIHSVSCKWFFSDRQTASSSGCLELLQLWSPPVLPLSLPPSMSSTTRIPYASFPLSPLASSPRLHQALSPTRSPFPGPLPPPSGLEAPSPSSPLPELLRGYQHALATEQQASHAIEELHREIAELVEMQLNLQKMGSKSQSQSYGRQPADAADHARRLAVCQIQVRRV
jgi:hypothetical protein